MRSAGLWLLLQNHLGQSVRNEPRMNRAYEIRDKARGTPKLIEDIAFLSNVQVVSLHNECRFQEAFEALDDTIQLLEEENTGGRKARFIWEPDDAPRRGRAYGALFGTHAQSIAFRAHRHLLLNRLEDLCKDTERAVRLSSMAMDFFPTEDDRERHVTYQAHMHLQTYLVSKSASL